MQGKSRVSLACHLAVTAPKPARLAATTNPFYGDNHSYGGGDGHRQEIGR